jgi:hypothetical protein
MRRFVRSFEVTLSVYGRLAIFFSPFMRDSTICTCRGTTGRGVSDALLDVVGGFSCGFVGFSCASVVLVATSINARTWVTVLM